MDNIICDICGSEYPETMAQCPICGCAKKETAPASPEGEGGFVKGGRFSKSNVRRRMRTADAPATSEAVKRYVSENDETRKPKAPKVSKQDEVEADEQEPRSNMPLMLIVILLLLAIIAVSVYIVVAFGGPNTNAGQTTTTQSVNNATGPCVSITVSHQSITLTVGQSQQLDVQKSPSGSLDEIRKHVEDPEIVSLDANYNVVALKEGNTKIHFYCGSISAVVEVTVKAKPTESTTKPTTQPTTKPTFPQNSQFEIPAGAVAQAPRTIIVNNDYLNVRSSPAVKNNNQVCQVFYGEELTLYGTYQASDRLWGYTNKGWVAMEYVRYA